MHPSLTCFHAPLGTRLPTAPSEACTPPPGSRAGSSPMCLQTGTGPPGPRRGRSQSDSVIKVYLSPRRGHSSPSAPQPWLAQHGSQALREETWDSGDQRSAGAPPGCVLGISDDLFCAPGPRLRSTTVSQQHSTLADTLQHSGTTAKYEPEAGRKITQGQGRSSGKLLKMYLPVKCSCGQG